MTSFNVLHIDDEPDIREIVAMSFGLDPDAKVRGCASGKDGLAAATEDVPDLILLDVMMPVMDGPTTLARLRENPRTANIPIVFMTARAQAREIEQFKSLGAAGVIAKPFDPMTLAAAVRSHLHPAADGLTISRVAFHERVVRDSDSLLHCLSAIVHGMTVSSVHRRIRDLAHGLAGAAGIFGYPEIGDAAASLEQAAVAELGGAKAPKKLARAIQHLLTSIRKSIPDLKLNYLRFDA
jgi:CheY-like chemotaxis protein